MTAEASLRARHPQSRTSVREFERLLAPAEIARGAAGRRRWSCPPRTVTHSPPTRSRKARAAAAATGAAGDRRRLGHRGGGARRAPGRALGSIRRACSATDRGEPGPSCCREAPAGSGLRYVCALAYVDPAGGAEHVFFGDCRGPAGRRGARRRGDSATTRRSCPTTIDDGRTMAELSDEEKDAISHRGRAVRASCGLAAWPAYLRLMPAETATANVTPAYP